MNLLFTENAFSKSLILTDSVYLLLETPDNEKEDRNFGVWSMVENPGKSHS